MFFSANENDMALNNLPLTPQLISKDFTHIKLKQCSIQTDYSEFVIESQAQ